MKTSADLAQQCPGLIAFSKTPGYAEYWNTRTVCGVFTACAHLAANRPAAMCVNGPNDERGGIMSDRSLTTPPFRFHLTLVARQIRSFHNEPSLFSLGTTRCSTETRRSRIDDGMGSRFVLSDAFH